MCVIVYVSVFMPLISPFPADDESWTLSTLEHWHAFCIRWEKIWNGISSCSTSLLTSSIYSSEMHNAFPSQCQVVYCCIPMLYGNKRCHIHEHFTFRPIHLSVFDCPSIHMHVQPRHSVRSFIKMYLNGYEACARVRRFHSLAVWQIPKLFQLTGPQSGPTNN